MRNLMVTRLREVKTAIAKGEAFLLSRQAGDGYWRDYSLPPGPSEAWTTAFIGWTLAQAPTRQSFVFPLRVAADALHALRRPEGWGYNRHTATDADSTAWVWRLLATLDDYRGVAASSSLRMYLSDTGAARTFLSSERFGTWAQTHADVTPVVGLALLAVGAEPSLVGRLRHASLAARVNGGLWRSFWWTTDSYAIARNLELISATGGVPPEVFHAACDWLRNIDGPRSSLEAAQHLNIAVSLRAACMAIGERLQERLLRWQLGDGSWSESPVLLAPTQWRDSERGGGPAYADTERLMSTATVVGALKCWLLATISADNVILQK